MEVSGTSVEYVINACGLAYEPLTLATAERFENKPREYEHFDVFQG